MGIVILPDNNLSNSNVTIFDTSTITNSAINVDQEDGALLDETAEFIFQLFLYIILSCTICGFGIIGNIINLIVFVKQGLFSGGSILSLYSLALADLGVVSTNFLHGIGFIIIVADIPNLPFDPFDVLYVVLNGPHNVFVIINRLLTAYIAFERCMCVMLPFRVQSLFSPKKSLAYIITIYSYTFLSHLPEMFTQSLEFRQVEGTNQSKLVLSFNRHRDIIHNVIYFSNIFAFSFASVLTVAICTLITSVRIYTSKQWRKSVTAESGSKSRSLETKNKAKSDDNTGNISQSVDEQLGKSFYKNTLPEQGCSKNVSHDKEARLVKTIMTISVIFLVCYIPDLCFLILKWSDDRVRVKGQYHRLANLMFSIMFVFDSLNSSLNILVYYRMGSAYRAQFQKIFRS